MRTKEECDKLYREHKHLIDITIAKNFNNPTFLDLHGITPEELYQSGRIGLHRACKNYDESKGASFQTHVINYIKWFINVEAMRDSLGSSKKWTFDLANRLSFDMELDNINDEVVSLYDLVGEEDQGYSETEEDIQMKFLLSKIEKNTTERVWEIVQLKMKGLTNQQVADKLGVTHQNVSKTLRYHKQKIKELIAA